jgi:hypothetical protein
VVSEPLGALEGEGEGSSAIAAVCCVAENFGGRRRRAGGTRSWLQNSVGLYESRRLGPGSWAIQ